MSFGLDPSANSVSCSTKLHLQGISFLLSVSPTFSGYTEFRASINNVINA